MDDGIFFLLMVGLPAFFAFIILTFILRKMFRIDRIVYLLQETLSELKDIRDNTNQTANRPEKPQQTSTMS